jgi:hypothetical protein
MGMITLPRNGRYEIFTYNNRTHCFDDPDVEQIVTPSGMFEWIRNQDPAHWKGLDYDPDSNTAFYLDPNLYLLWKLKWL